MKLKRIYLALAISVLVLAVAAPQFILAQGETTLEDLAEQLLDTVTQLQEIVTRVETLEAVWEGPGAYETRDGNCAIGVDGTLQDSSVLKYKEEFEDWPIFSRMNVKTVEIDSETGEIAITYGSNFDYNRVTETWDGCDFVETLVWEVEN